MKKLLLFTILLFCFTAIAQGQSAESTAEPTAYLPATLHMFRNVTLLTDSPKRSEKIELSADIDAIESAKPKPRYAVGYVAGTLLRLNKWLPTCLYDKMVTIG